MTFLANPFLANPFLANVCCVVLCCVVLCCVVLCCVVLCCVVLCCVFFDTEEQQCKISHMTSRETRITSIPTHFVRRWGGAVVPQSASPFQEAEQCEKNRLHPLFS